MHFYIYIYIYIYIYLWRKLKNKVNQKWWTYYEEKSTLKCFSFNEPSSGLENDEATLDRTSMDVW